MNYPVKIRLVSNSYGVVHNTLTFIIGGLPLLEPEDRQPDRIDK